MTNADPPTSDSPSGFELGGPRWTRWLWVPVILVLAGFAAWWMTHPEELPSSQNTLDVSTKAGKPIYVGVTDDDDLDDSRELHIREVTFKTLLSRGSVDVEALVCHDGSINTTTDPELFCVSVEDAEGATIQLGGGDQLVISVTADSSQIVELSDLKLSYREGMQWGTQPIGPAVVVDVIG
jgi:hypothetical protein